MYATDTRPSQDRETLHTAHEALDKVTASLSDALNELCAKLGPLLLEAGPSVPQTDRPGPRGQMSVVRTRVTDVGERIEAAVQQVRAITRGLDL